MRATINAKRVTDKASLHELLRQKLSLPADCGRNLDAVYDVLTDPGKDRIITVKHEALLRERLGDYAESFLQMLEDACESGHVKLIRK
ncbi:MAG: barstar family protein [Oscillospiraceae bacterium]|nr:barstar family protein [Oscillospiraceae bacterium]MBR4193390.1 barstar family protein [Oscillospiraceae bacterium]